MALSLDSVGYEYAAGTSLSHVALAGVSIDIEPGKFVLVIGQTGSGKSTLLRIASGLLEPSQGRVSCDGGNVSPAKVGMVFQQPESQLFSETVLEDVEFGPMNLGMAPDEAAARAEEALRQVGLDPGRIGQRSPFALSGGQARRVAIAGVLAMKPAYLLLDEPSAGLDGNGRRFVQSLLAQQRANGCGIVVVSHDIDEFLGMADEVMLLEGGHSVWQGDAHELISNAGTLFARASLDMPPLLSFQQSLGCMAGSYSADVDQVAQWALSGFPVPGPLPHVHAGVEAHDANFDDGASSDDAGVAHGGAGEC